MPDWVPPTDGATVKRSAASSFDAAVAFLGFHSRCQRSRHRLLGWRAASLEPPRCCCWYSAGSMPSAKCPTWRIACRHLASESETTWANRRKKQNKTKKNKNKSTSDFLNTLRGCNAEFFLGEGHQRGAFHVETLQRKRTQIALTGRPQEPTFDVILWPGARICRSKQTNKTKAIKTLLTSLSRLVTSPVFYQSPTYLATLIATLAKFAFHVGSFIFPLFFYRHHFLIRLINLSVSARQSARFDKAIAFCSRHLILFYFLNFFFWICEADVLQLLALAITFRSMRWASNYLLSRIISEQKPMQYAKQFKHSVDPN